MHDRAASLIGRLWTDYKALNPFADTLRHELTRDGGEAVHDHVALRTVSHPRFGLARTARPFHEAGYERVAEYQFPAKHLVAEQYALADRRLPDVFITELQLDACSRDLRGIIGSLARDLRPDDHPPEAFATGGRLWHPVLREVHDRLRRESKQAAWFAAFGFRAHRFAILLNALATIPADDALRSLLDRHGLCPESAELSAGDESLGRTQSIAIPTTVRLADGPAVVPGVRDGFVRRGLDAHGALFRGFVPGRAADGAAAAAP